MNNLKTVILLVIIFVLAIAGIYYLYQTQVSKNENLLPYPSPATTFDDLVPPSPLASPIGISNPPRVQPEAGADTLSVNGIGIQVESPQASSVISSPLTVTGNANVFDGKVVIKIIDSDGKVLGKGEAVACMGYNACHFDATISFNSTQSEAGIIQVYNPSGVDGSPKYLQQILVRF